MRTLECNERTHLVRVLDKNTVYEVVAGEEVMLWCPEQLKWIHCVVEYMGCADVDKRIYITTKDSRSEEYNNRSRNSDPVVYGDYIKHLRFDNDPKMGCAAVMSREKMAELLDNRNYLIR